VSLLRALLAVLALGAAVPGTWAMLAPRSFYGDFPGPSSWVSELPPYNAHLVTDVGAFYLAFTLLFAWAALRPDRALVLPLCTGWALFGSAHLAWHVTHLEGFSAIDAIGQTTSLVLVLVAALAAAALAIRLSTSDRAMATTRATRRPGG
jgi:hypothetical protein